MHEMHVCIYSLFHPTQLPGITTLVYTDTLPIIRSLYQAELLCFKKKGSWMKLAEK